MERWKTSRRTDEPSGRDLAFRDNVIQFPSPAKNGRAELFATIYEQIIPELILAHRTETPPEGADACTAFRPAPTEEEVSQFARIAVSQDLSAALAFIQAMACQGISLEVVLLQLIAPAARLLGADWEEDTRSFTEVTIGLCLLQKVVAILGPSFAPAIGTLGFVVLVSPQPEQHTLGIYLLGEFLRKAGWSVQVAPTMSEAAVLTLVESERVEVVGLSVSNTELLGSLGSLVRAIKSASLNPDLAVMLGGTREIEKYAKQLGATYCSDAPAAVRWLEQYARVSQENAHC